MKNKNKIKQLLLVLAMLIVTNSYSQVFEVTPGTSGEFGRTETPFRGVGVGNFPSSQITDAALHVNTNYMSTSTNYPGINFGEVFRTDGPAGNSYWRMFSNATERLRLEWDNTNSVSLFQSVNAPLSIRALANQPITFFTGATNTEKVRITNAGEVGIGTAYPESTLDVNGSIQAKEIVVISATGKRDLLAMIIQLQSEVAQLKQQIHALANH